MEVQQFGFKAKNYNIFFNKVNSPQYFVVFAVVCQLLSRI